MSAQPRENPILGADHPNLQGYYTYGSVSTATDLSLVGNDGNQGQLLGQDGAAIVFADNSSFVRWTSGTFSGMAYIHNSGVFTLSFKLKYTSGTYVLGNADNTGNDGFAFRGLSGGDMTFFVSRSAANPQGDVIVVAPWTPNATEFQSIIATGDGSTVRLYVDNVEIGNEPIVPVTTPVNADKALVLGMDPSLSFPFSSLTGTIGSFRHFDITVTESQRTALSLETQS
tara:strand:+ start:4107 stop:4790 length:684 start_codon:yes stop_codon:yes gene_type:complete